MESCSATATLRAHTHVTRASGFWGERVQGSLANKYALLENFPKGLKINKCFTKKIQPIVAVNALTSEDPIPADFLCNKTQPWEQRTADPKKVVSIILGGGVGAELFPLTTRTSTPAVSVGGCYKLIDIPMSNSINSGINKIFILTQFNSASLNRHIHRTYSSRDINFVEGFVEVTRFTPFPSSLSTKSIGTDDLGGVTHNLIYRALIAHTFDVLAATQTQGESGMKWFQGTADAVRQFDWLLEDVRNKDVENVVVLSADQLYRMDYMEIVQHHIDTKADITVSCVPVDESHASQYGLMKIDSEGRVIEFSEKPKGHEMKSMAIDKLAELQHYVKSAFAHPWQEITTRFGSLREIATEKPYIASMGVYVFKKEVLFDLLKCRYPTANDFGSEIIPAAVKELNVQAYLFNDYWEDIGTLKAFYEANLALTKENPNFEFYDPKTPFYTSPRFLPPTKMDNCKIKDAIISHGCFLRECVIRHSIVGERSRLDYGVELKDTLMMGADDYQTESEIATLLAEGKVPIGIGRNTKIRKCIIDKNARIGKDVIIRNKNGVQEADRPNEGFYIRSGIVIIMEKATIPDGTVI